MNDSDGKTINHHCCELFILPASHLNLAEQIAALPGTRAFVDEETAPGQFLAAGSVLADQNWGLHGGSREEK